MANRIIFRLARDVSDILKNYPELTVKQAKQVLDELSRVRNALIQQGWYVIADILNGPGK